MIHKLFRKKIFSIFHPNKFRDTTSWKCFVKNDGVRSCMIELQSFLLSKFDIDPITPCFDVTSMLYACTVQGAVLPSRLSQDPCVPYL